MPLSARTLRAMFHLATVAAFALGAMAAAAEFLFDSRAIAVLLGVATALALLVSAYAESTSRDAAQRELGAWRELTPQQRAAVVKDLSPRPFPVEVDSARSPESESYAAEIRAALTEAGCTVTTNGAVTEEGHFWGLLGPGPEFETPEAKQLHAAFRAANIALRVELDPTATVRILVGSKPPPSGKLQPEQPISSSPSRRKGQRQ